MPLRMLASLTVPLNPMSLWSSPYPTAAPMIRLSATRTSNPAVTPEVENLVEATSGPVEVMRPNSTAPLAQIAIGGPDGSQVEAGVAGRGAGYGSLFTGGNALPAIGPAPAPIMGSDE